MDVDLDPSTIAAIRTFIDARTSRSDLKNLALSAGAKSERVMPIKISSSMSSPGYKTKAELMNEIVDTVYIDFEKSEADRTLLRMIHVLISDHDAQILPEQLEALEKGLARSGLSISQVTRYTTTVRLLEVAAERAEDSAMNEATDLLMKGLLRLSTDPPGAITACTSACESACRIALERLSLPLPARKQLPEYLDALCDQTNIKALARVSGEDTRKIFGALRGLAHNSYRAAHQLGDRHAQGDGASISTAIGADLVIVSCAALTTVIAGAVARNELQPVCNK